MWPHEGKTTVYPALLGQGRPYQNAHHAGTIPREHVQDNQEGTRKINLEQFEWWSETGAFQIQSLWT